MVVVVLAACSGAVVQDPPTSDAPLMTTATVDAEVRAARDALSAVDDGGFDHEPVLTMTRVCYWGCLPSYAFPEFAIYPDGSLAVMDRSGDNRVRSFDVSQVDLDMIAGLFRTGKLVGGGVHSLGTRAGMADGGGVVIETVIGATRTYVHVPSLDPTDPNRARNAVGGLRTLLRSYADGGDDTLLTTEWVMMGALFDRSKGLPWPIEGEPMGDPPCLVFDPADLPKGYEHLTRQRAYESAALAFDGISYVMNIRPLLPHENGCEDAQARLNRMFANDATLDLGGAGRPQLWGCVGELGSVGSDEGG